MKIKLKNWSFVGLPGPPALSLFLGSFPFSSLSLPFPQITCVRYSPPPPMLPGLMASYFSIMSPTFFWKVI